LNGRVCTREEEARVTYVERGLEYEEKFETEDEEKEEDKEEEEGNATEMLSRFVPS
jgi:hypothetical protein